MSKKTKIILGVLGAVVLGFVAMGFIKRKDKDVARVTTAKVEKIDLISKVTANGKIQARRKVDLSALVMGQIVNLAAKEGDRVQKGQLLLQIDRAQLAAQTAGRESALGAMRSDLVAAQSSADQARYDYERARRTGRRRSFRRPSSRRRSRPMTRPRRTCPPRGSGSRSRVRTWPRAGTLFPRRRSALRSRES